MRYAIYVLGAVIVWIILAIGIEYFFITGFEDDPWSNRVDYIFGQVLVYGIGIIVCLGIILAKRSAAKDLKGKTKQ